MNISTGISYYDEILQGSDEWLKLRMGVVTASEVSKLITPTGKLASGKKVALYANEIAAQQIVSHLEDGYQSFDMLRGHIQEDIAREIYSDNYEKASECGFITNDNYGVTIGCSPDGLIGSDGGIEIKSRLAKFQVETIINNEVPSEYMIQVQTCLLVTERDWWDFIQYSNGMPLFVQRVYPDAKMHETIVSAILNLKTQVDGVVAEYIEKSKAFIETEYVEIITDEISESE